jgi:RND family efflux transporter MFP subunit
VNRRHGSLLLAVAVLVAVSGTLAYWRFLRALTVPVAAVQAGRVQVQVVGPGTVQARVPVTLSARVTSTVTSVSVDVGDPVRAGQVLAVLDDREVAARRAAVGSQQVSLAQQVEGARAGLARAQADLDLARLKQARDADLLRQGFVSQAAYDASNAAAEGSKAALDGAEATLAARQADQATLVQEARVADTQVGFTRLAAPMNGVVTQRLAEPGTTVAPGTPILRLVDPGTLWVATRVDESAVARVKPGQPATIRLRSGEIVPGRVARIAMQSDAATRELDVHVAFVDPPRRFAIDQEAEVRIGVGEDEGPVIPLASLARDRDGRQGVLRVVDGRARFTPVVLGATDDARAAVREGLAAGDIVVARPGGVQDGQRVQGQTPAAPDPPSSPAAR